ncbi:MAG: hypothetical protein OEU92_17800, partial [Alphaproteobacteria bacterium]|nr:hypothetical protein [Alphaproteobacteria bacterium]
EVCRNPLLPRSEGGRLQPKAILDKSDITTFILPYPQRLLACASALQLGGWFGDRSGKNG